MRDRCWPAWRRRRVGPLEITAITVGKTAADELTEAAQRAVVVAGVVIGLVDAAADQRARDAGQVEQPQRRAPQAVDAVLIGGEFPKSPASVRSSAPR